MQKRKWIKKAIKTIKEKMIKPTPGKWNVVFKNGHYSVEGKSVIVCHIQSYGMQNQKEEYYLHEKREAVLIAAAPELLEACKIALQEFNEMGYEPPKYKIELLRQAIAKAEEKK